MKTKEKDIKYSLGYNFDNRLLEKVIELNESNHNKIVELYGALKDSPIPSARPTKRIPSVSWKDLEKQIKIMSHSNIEFNYLMNTFYKISKETELKLKSYFNRLFEIGIKKVTVGNPEMCEYFKNIDDRLEITISSIYGIKTKLQIQEAINKGADEIYLDSLYVNRNIKLLKELINTCEIKIKLYANISCLSQCPLKNEHYAVFFGKQNVETVKKNDKYFEWCSKIKLKNPVHWLQMPWIRPEDIRYYNNLGIHSFKLSDRLAPTDTLLFIASHYLSERSPDNLFRLIERDGAKYKNILQMGSDQYPIYVDSSKIPKDFLFHFIEGHCNSNDTSCSFCNSIAQQAIKYFNNNKNSKQKLEYETTENHSY